jgi:hypothetical protein
MTFNEDMTRVLLVTATLSRPVYIAMGATLIVGAILIPLCRRTWLHKRSFSWLGIFYRQTTVGCLRAACAWVKLLMLIILLAEHRVLNLADYIMLILPGLIYAALSRSPAAFISKFTWTALEVVGMFAVNILCGYIIEMNPGFAYTLIYVLLSVFIGIFGVYLFMREIHAVSTERGRG